MELALQFVQIVVTETQVIGLARDGSVWLYSPNESVWKPFPMKRSA